MLTEDEYQACIRDLIAVCRAASKALYMPTMYADDATKKSLVKQACDQAAERAEAAMAERETTK